MGTNSSLSARISRNNWLRYSLATLAVVAAWFLCVWLSSIAADRATYVVLFLGVSFAAWYCGLGPSILAIVLAGVGVTYGFVLQPHSFVYPGIRGLLNIVALLLCCAIVVVMGESRRRENERLRRGQGELEIKVRERTADLDAVNRSLRDLSGRLMQMRDEERRRIARELHDSVGQTLAALGMNLSAVRTGIEQLSKTAARLSDSESLVQDMVTEVRTISHLLHPPLLDEAGLSSALRWYVDGFAQRSGIKVDLDMPEDFGRLPIEAETAIFRVVQESLTNIHRHSGSSVARIRVRERDQEVLVDVEDKGKGIPAERLAELDSGGVPGVGIRGMQERLRQLGGTFDVKSNDSGTVVLVRLPVGEAQATEDAPTSDQSSPAAA